MRGLIPEPKAWEGDLPILFQDEYLVAIDKPAGLLVHPGREPEAREWIAMKRLKDQLGQRVYPIHRLDRPTSGVLLFALDKESAGFVQQEFEQRRVSKSYLAVVTGEIPEDWVCETPLKRDEEDEEGLPAETAFRRLAMTKKGVYPADPSLVLSLVGAKPLTGRFHQIRRHLVEAGHPIVGDFRYGGIDRCNELGAILETGNRMLLQASVLEIRHPQTGEILTIEAPRDPEFSKIFPIQA